MNPLTTISIIVSLGLLSRAAAVAAGHGDWKGAEVNGDGVLDASEQRRHGKWHRGEC